MLLLILSAFVVAKVHSLTKNFFISESKASTSGCDTTTYTCNGSYEKPFPNLLEAYENASTIISLNEEPLQVNLIFLEEMNSIKSQDILNIWKRRGVTKPTADLVIKITQQNANFSIIPDVKLSRASINIKNEDFMISFENNLSIERVAFIFERNVSSSYKIFFLLKKTDASVSISLSDISLNTNSNKSAFNFTISDFLCFDLDVKSFNVSVTGCEFYLNSPSCLINASRFDNYSFRLLSIKNTSFYIFEQFYKKIISGIRLAKVRAELNSVNFSFVNEKLFSNNPVFQLDDSNAVVFNDFYIFFNQSNILAAAPLMCTYFLNSSLNNSVGLFNGSITGNINVTILASTQKDISILYLRENCSFSLEKVFVTLNEVEPYTLNNTGNFSVFRIDNLSSIRVRNTLFNRISVQGLGFNVGSNNTIEIVLTGVINIVKAKFLRTLNFNNITVKDGYFQNISLRLFDSKLINLTDYNILSVENSKFFNITTRIITARLNSTVMITDCLFHILTLFHSNGTIYNSVLNNTILTFRSTIVVNVTMNFGPDWNNLYGYGAVVCAIGNLDLQIEESLFMDLYANYAGLVYAEINAKTLIRVTSTLLEGFRALAAIGILGINRSPNATFILENSTIRDTLSMSSVLSKGSLSRFYIKIKTSLIRDINNLNAISWLFNIVSALISLEITDSKFINLTSLGIIAIDKLTVNPVTITIKSVRLSDIYEPWDLFKSEQTLSDTNLLFEDFYLDNFICTKCIYTVSITSFLTARITLNVTNCFVWNTSLILSSGLFFFQPNSLGPKVIIKNSLFSNLTTFVESVLLKISPSSSSQITISDCRISNVEATSGLLLNLSPIKGAKIIISNNVVDGLNLNGKLSSYQYMKRGGIACLGTDAADYIGASFYFKNNTISNLNSIDEGGILYINAVGFQNFIFENNTIFNLKVYRGGVFNSIKSTSTLTYYAFVNNTIFNISCSDQGGIFYLSFMKYVSLTLKNNLIEALETYFTGGLISMYSSQDVYFFLENSSITNVQMKEGSGFLNATRCDNLAIHFTNLSIHLVFSAVRGALFLFKEGENLSLSIKNNTIKKFRSNDAGDLMYIVIWKGFDFSVIDTVLDNENLTRQDSSMIFAELSNFTVKIFATKILNYDSNLIEGKIVDMALDIINCSLKTPESFERSSYLIFQFTNSKITLRNLTIVAITDSYFTYDSFLTITGTQNQIILVGISYEFGQSSLGSLIVIKPYGHNIVLEDIKLLSSKFKINSFVSSTIYRLQKPSLTFLKIKNCIFKIINGMQQGPFLVLDYHLNIILESLVFELDWTNISPLIKVLWLSSILNNINLIKSSVNQTNVRVISKNTRQNLSGNNLVSASIFDFDEACSFIEGHNIFVSLSYSKYSSIFLLRKPMNMTLDRLNFIGNILNMFSSDGQRSLFLLDFSQLSQGINCQAYSIQVSNSLFLNNMGKKGTIFNLDFGREESSTFSTLLLEFNKNQVLLNSARETAVFLDLQEPSIAQRIICSRQFLKTENLSYIILKAKNNSFERAKAQNGALLSKNFFEPINSLWISEFLTSNDFKKVESAGYGGWISSPVKYLAISNSSSNLEESLLGEVKMTQQVNNYSFEKKKTNIPDYLTKLQIFDVVHDADVYPSCYFFIFFIDAMGEVIWNIPDIDNLTFSTMTTPLYMKSDEFEVYFSFKNGVLCAHRFKLKISSFPKDALTLLIKKNEWQNTFLNIAENQPDLSISVKFKTCDSSEKFDSYTFTCSACPRNTYLSLEMNAPASDESALKDISSDCKFCYEYHPFYCYGGVKRSPKPSFWRLDKDSNIFIQCPNKFACLGDIFYFHNLTSEPDLFFGNLRQISSYQYDSSSVAVQTGYCSLGHQGNLCAECEPGFGISQKYQCSRCGDPISLTKKILSLIIRLVCFYISLGKAFNMNKLLGESAENGNSELTTEQKNSVNSSFLIKIIFEHLQILLMLYSLPFKTPREIEDIFSVLIFSSSPDFQQVFSLECFLKESGFQSPVYYFTLGIIITFNLITIFLFIAYLSYKKSKALSKFQDSNKDIIRKFLSKGEIFINCCKQYFWQAILYVCLINIVAQVQPFIDTFNCINIGANKLRFIKDLSIDCSTDTHRYLQFALAGPVTLIVGIIFPFAVTIILFRAKSTKSLYTVAMLQKYGYFYFPYIQRVFYFETIVFLRKILLIILQLFFFISILAREFNLVNIVFLLLVYLVLFYLILIYLQPYNVKYFEKLYLIEKLSSIIMIMTTLLALLWLGQENEISIGLGISILIMVCLLNLLFIVIWVFNYFQFGKTKLYMIHRQMTSMMNKFNINNMLQSKSPVRKGKSRRTFESLDSMLASPDLKSKKVLSVSDVDNTSDPKLKSLQNLDLENQLETEKEKNKRAHFLRTVLLLPELILKTRNSFEPSREKPIDQEEICNAYLPFALAGYGNGVKEQIFEDEAERDSIFDENAMVRVPVSEIKTESHLLPAEPSSLKRETGADEVEAGELSDPRAKDHCFVTVLKKRVKGKSYDEYYLKLTMMVTNISNAQSLELFKFQTNGKANGLIIGQYSPDIKEIVVIPAQGDNKKMFEFWIRKLRTASRTHSLRFSYSYYYLDSNSNTKQHETGYLDLTIENFDFNSISWINPLIDNEANGPNIQLVSRKSKFYKSNEKKVESKKDLLEKINAFQIYKEKRREFSKDSTDELMAAVFTSCAQKPIVKEFIIDEEGSSGFEAHAVISAPWLNIREVKLVFLFYPAHMNIFVEDKSQEQELDFNQRKILISFIEDGTGFIIHKYYY